MSPFRRERRQKTSPFVERISIEVSLNESSLQRRSSFQGHTQGGSAARQTDTKREGRGGTKRGSIPSNYVFALFLGDICSFLLCAGSVFGRWEKTRGFS